MRFLLTGGAGFIGSHIVDRLLDRGDTVTVPITIDDAEGLDGANLSIRYDTDQLGLSWTALEQVEAQQCLANARVVRAEACRDRRLENRRPTEATYRPGDTDAVQGIDDQ